MRAHSHCCKMYVIRSLLVVAFFVSNPMNLWNELQLLKFSFVLPNNRIPLCHQSLPALVPTI